MTQGELLSKVYLRLRKIKERFKENKRQTQNIANPEPYCEGGIEVCKQRTYD